jgi:signal transduction histidine kinase
MSEPNEEKAAELRHYLRNRFAAIRNAAFYLQKRVATTSLWEEDERVRRFFDLIASELSDADDAISRNLRASELAGGDNDR